MREYFGTTVEEIFATQDERFRPEGAAGVEAVFGYEVTGEGGGRWRVVVRAGQARTERVETGVALGSCSLVLTVDAETFVGVALGKIDGQEAIAGGKLRFDGDAKLLAVLPRLFTKFVPRKRSPTAFEIVSTLPERVRPENAKGLATKIGYDLTGEGGGRWTAVVREGACSVEDGLAPDAAVTQTVSAKDFVDLVVGKLDPMIAIGAGRLRISGDMELAQKLPKLFSRFVPKGAAPEPELVVLKKTISVGMRYSTGPVMGRFLDGLKGRKILANVCPRCGRRQLPPREVCALCVCRVRDFAEVGPEGIMTALEVVHYASPDPLSGAIRETPYGTIYVLLDGCKGTETLWHILKREDLFETRPGDRVRPVWAETRTGSIHDIVCFERVR